MTGFTENSGPEVRFFPGSRIGRNPGAPGLIRQGILSEDQRVILSFPQNKVNFGEKSLDKRFHLCNLRLRIGMTEEAGETESCCLPSSMNDHENRIKGPERPEIQKGDRR
jgi:hypothetical protein